MENLTVEYIRSSKLSLCYSDSEIQALIDRVNAGESRIDVLLSIPRSDAIRVLAGLASPEVTVKVSACAASRAKEYAASAKTRYDYAAEDELAITIRDYCRLLGWV